MKLREDRDYLDTAQLIITILTAGFALKLNYTQGQLSTRIQREGITHTYAEKILSHLNDLKIDPDQKGAVVIDVLDIITEANLNLSERPYTDSERQQLIPLRLALATHDSDSLAHIGTGKAKRELWTQMAIQSGNNDIKRTAIRALAQIGRYRSSVAELETFRFCVKNILEISDDFARTPLTQDAIEQFSIMVGVTRKFPILLEDELLTALMQRGRDALVVVTSNAIKDNAEKQPTAAPVPQGTPTPPPLKPISQSEAGVKPRGDVYTLIRTNYQADNSVRSGDPAGVRQEPPRIVVASSAILRASQKALEQVNHLNLKATATRQSTAAEKDSFNNNIEAVKSDKVEVRRKARDDLAAGGAANVPLLLEALRKEPNDYRIKVGVSFALFRIKELVQITAHPDVVLLVALIGDDEPEVRQFASEFLMRLSDEGSIGAILPELKRVVASAEAVLQPNENAVYNAVVILGTWMRTLPDELMSQKQEIKAYLSELSLPKEKWAKTIAVISELNSMAVESKTDSSKTGQSE